MPILPEGRWSLRYEACVECGSTDRKHAAHGRCDWCHDHQPERMEHNRLSANARYQRRIGSDASPRPPRGHPRKAEPIAPVFPRVGAKCLLIIGVPGRIVGYSPVLDEWTVRTADGECLPWEPCDVLPLPNPKAVTPMNKPEPSSPSSVGGGGA